MTLGKFFFKYRSFTPIPFLIPLFLFGRPTWSSLITGLLIVIVGELIRIWGVSYAGSETRTTKVGASALVTQGPFAIVRNPLYLGNLLIYFGISVMARSLFPWLQIIGLLYFYMQYYFIIKEEEEFLEDKFKEKYEDYRNTVPKLIPTMKPYPEEKQSKLKPDYKAAIKSEKRTFQSIGTIIIMVILIHFLANA